MRFARSRGIVEHVKIEETLKIFKITRRRHRINLSGIPKPSFTAAIRDILLAHVAQHCKHFFQI